MNYKIIFMALQNNLLSDPKNLLDKTQYDMRKKKPMLSIIYAISKIFTMKKKKKMLH